jgi:hypothetical protein
VSDEDNLDTVDGVVVDVADLILELAVTGRVDRTVLRTEWKREATDLRRHPAARRYADAGKGAWASRVLVVAIVRLEKLGLVRRVGQPPRQALLIEDRPGLKRLVASWDAAGEETTSDHETPAVETLVSPSPLARWRRGDRDDEARAAHLADLRARRRAAAARRLGPGTRAHLLREIATGRPLPDVAAALGVTTHAIHGLARVDEDWRRDLDAALVAGCPADVPHGTPAGYRRHGCRCPDCREAHHRNDRPRPKHTRVLPEAEERVCECCGGPVWDGSERRFCSHSCGTRHTVHASCGCGGVVVPGQ